MHDGTIAPAKPEPSDGLKITTLIFAIAAGLSVANIYYAQPLLHSLARDFGMSPSSVGVVVTLTQVGYGLGLVFVVPLGDLIAPRRLILTQGALSILALVGVATATTEAILLVSLAAWASWLSWCRYWLPSLLAWQHRPTEAKLLAP